MLGGPHDRFDLRTERTRRGPGCRRSAGLGGLSPGRRRRPRGVMRRRSTGNRIGVSRIGSEDRRADLQQGDRVGAGSPDFGASHRSGDRALRPCRRASLLGPRTSPGRPGRTPRPPRIPRPHPLQQLGQAAARRGGTPRRGHRPPRRGDRGRSGRIVRDDLGYQLRLAQTGDALGRPECGPPELAALPRTRWRGPRGYRRVLRPR